MVAAADFAYQIAIAESLNAAQDILSRISSLIPIHAAICILARLDAQEGVFEVKTLLNVGYPPEWLALYQARRYDRVDPVLRTHYAHYVPQVWSQTYKAITSATEKYFVEMAREFGLKEGMTLGMACNGQGYGSVLSFAGDELSQTPRHRTILEFLAPALHGVLGRQATTGPGAAIALTAREREALRWASLGKTTWEMGRIMGISGRTVVFHLRNTMRKLGARNRAQAIAKAAALGIFDEYQ
ncbi:MAG: LuxR family transcriptional regulator [Acidiferrobacter sp.]